MAAPAKPIKPTAPRKRNRKRKRRAASESSSSSSSSESDSDENSAPTRKLSVAATKTRTPSPTLSSSSSSSSESETEDEAPAPATIAPAANQAASLKPTARPARRDSPSPPPQSTAIPSFLPEGGAASRDAGREEALKEKFRKFWMGAIADGFKEDLEQIRKEPNIGKSRLALLIDSLASGADVFSSSAEPGNNINEMEVVLE